MAKELNGDEPLASGPFSACWGADEATSHPETPLFVGTTWIYCLKATESLEWIVQKALLISSGGGCAALPYTSWFKAKASLTLTLSTKKATDEQHPQVLWSLEGAMIDLKQ